MMRGRAFLYGRMISLAEPVQPEAEGVSDEFLASLLARAARGDAHSWRELVKLYGRRVFALARSRCQSPEAAEEITQSVFVTVAQKLSSGQYAEQGKFEPWLFRVAMNRIRDESRRRARHAIPTDPDSFSEVRGRAEQVDLAASEQGIMEQAALREAMKELSEQDREIIELRHHGQMNFKEMSLLLDEPLGTLLARHHRALRKLKECIESRLNNAAVQKDLP